MGEYPDNPGPLPAEKLQNRGEGEEAKGALGNESAGKMFYEGSDRKALVEVVQRMLRELQYDIGDTGPGGDGVDGVFGKKTEDAVKEFQKSNKGWDGEPLKVDGLVGPRTSDALNRAMVGRWYGHYQTPLSLTAGIPHHTVTAGYLGNGLSIRRDGAIMARVFVAGEIPETAFEAPLIIRLIDGAGEPLKRVAYTLEMDDPSFKGVAGETDDKGVLSQRIPCKAKAGRLKLDTCDFDLTIEKMEPASSEKGALVRLCNMGYLSGDSEGQSGAGEISDAIKRFKGRHMLDANGKLDGPTSKKLEEAYGS